MTPKPDGFPDRRSSRRPTGLNWRRVMKRWSFALLVLGSMAVPAVAGPAFSCGGFALLGGAQLLCSHVDPQAPAQFCTYSWALTGIDGTPSVAQGSFLLEPGIANATVYQGSGFSGQLGTPIVLCQGKKSR